MARRWRQRPWAALLLGVACVATTCHMPVGFRISGTLESGVHLRMFDPKDEATVTIEELVVSEITGSEDWSVHAGSEERVLKIATSRTVWRLVGRAKIPEIVYGNAPHGLEATEGPVPLAPRKTYDVFVGGTIGRLLRSCQEVCKRIRRRPSG